jgi:hypothetical protein
MGRKLMPGPFPNRVKPHRISEINAVPFQQVPVASLCMMHRNATLKKTRTKNLQYKKNSPATSVPILQPHKSIYFHLHQHGVGERGEQERVVEDEADLFENFSSFFLLPLPPLYAFPKKTIIIVV